MMHNTRSSQYVHNIGLYLTIVNVRFGIPNICIASCRCAIICGALDNGCCDTNANDGQSGNSKLLIEVNCLLNFVLVDQCVLNLMQFAVAIVIAVEYWMKASLLWIVCVFVTTMMDSTNKWKKMHHPHDQNCFDLCHKPCPSNEINHPTTN